MHICTPAATSNIRNRTLGKAVKVFATRNEHNREPRSIRRNRRKSLRPPLSENSFCMTPNFISVARSSRNNMTLTLASYRIAARSCTRGYRTNNNDQSKLITEAAHDPSCGVAAVLNGLILTSTSGDTGILYK